MLQTNEHDGNSNLYDFYISVNKPLNYWISPKQAFLLLLYAFSLIDLYCLLIVQ